MDMRGRSIGAQENQRQLTQNRFVTTSPGNIAVLVPVTYGVTSSNQKQSRNANQLSMNNGTVRTGRAVVSPTNNNCKPSTGDEAKQPQNTTTSINSGMSVTVPTPLSVVQMQTGPYLDRTLTPWLNKVIQTSVPDTHVQNSYVPIAMKEPLKYQLNARAGTVYYPSETTQRYKNTPKQTYHLQSPIELKEMPSLKKVNKSEQTASAKPVEQVNNQTKYNHHSHTNSSDKMNNAMNNKQEVVQPNTYNREKQMSTNRDYIMKPQANTDLDKMHNVIATGEESNEDTTDNNTETEGNCVFDLGKYMNRAEVPNINPCMLTGNINLNFNIHGKRKFSLTSNAKKPDHLGTSETSERNIFSVVNGKVYLENENTVRGNSPCANNYGGSNCNSCFHQDEKEIKEPGNHIQMQSNKCQLRYASTHAELVSKNKNSKSYQTIDNEADFEKTACLSLHLKQQIRENKAMDRQDTVIDDCTRKYPYNTKNVTEPSKPNSDKQKSYITQENVAEIRKRLKRLNEVIAKRQEVYSRHYACAEINKTANSSSEHREKENNDALQTQYINGSPSGSINRKDMEGKRCATHTLIQNQEPVVDRISMENNSHHIFPLSAEPQTSSPPMDVQILRQSYANSTQHGEKPQQIATPQSEPKSQCPSRRNVPSTDDNQQTKNSLTENKTNLENIRIKTQQNLQDKTHETEQDNLGINKTTSDEDNNIVSDVPNLCETVVTQNVGKSILPVLFNDNPNMESRHVQPFTTRNQVQVNKVNLIAMEEANTDAKTHENENNTTTYRQNEVSVELDAENCEKSPTEEYFDLMVDDNDRDMAPFQSGSNSSCAETINYIVSNQLKLHVPEMTEIKETKRRKRKKRHTPATKKKRYVNGCKQQDNISVPSADEKQLDVRACDISSSSDDELEEQCRDENNMKVVVTDIHSPKCSPHICSVCGASFAYKLQLNKHTLKHREQEIITNGNNNDQNEQKCKYCFKTFQCPEDMFLHIRHHRLKCVTCGIKFKKLSSLSRHMKRYHNYSIAFSNKTSDQLDDNDLNSKDKSSSDSRNFACNEEQSKNVCTRSVSHMKYCGIIIDDIDRLPKVQVLQNKLASKHTAYGYYICNGCGYKCKSRKETLLHRYRCRSSYSQKIIGDEKENENSKSNDNSKTCPNRCSHCKKSFKSPKYAKLHVQFCNALLSAEHKLPLNETQINMDSTDMSCIENNHFTKMTLHCAEEIKQTILTERNIDNTDNCDKPNSTENYHIVVDNANIASILRCVTCKQIFQNSALMSQHHCSSPMLNLLEPVTNEASNQSTAHNTENDDTLMNSKDKQNIHQSTLIEFQGKHQSIEESNNSEQIICRFCDCTFNNKTQLKWHIKMSHTYHCDICDVAFQWKKAVSHHMNSCHNIKFNERSQNKKVYRCKFCNKKVKKTNQLKVHLLFCKKKINLQKTENCEEPIIRAQTSDNRDIVADDNNLVEGTSPTSSQDSRQTKYMYYEGTINDDQMLPDLHKQIESLESEASDTSYICDNVENLSIVFECQECSAMFAQQHRLHKHMLKWHADKLAYYYGSDKNKYKMETTE